MALCVLLLAAVALDIHAHGPLSHLDHDVGERMADWGLRYKTGARLGLTPFLYFGQRGVVLTLSVGLAAWLSRRQRTFEPILRLLVALVLIFAVIYAFKLGLARNAPIQDAHGVPSGHGASFPSGHVANAVVLWGLGDWSVRHWPTPPWLQRVVRIGRWIGPFCITIAMTLLNYHWLSDFIGGALVGVVLLSASLLPVWTTAAGRLDRRLGLRSCATP